MVLVVGNRARPLGTAFTKHHQTMQLAYNTALPHYPKLHNGWTTTRHDYFKPALPPDSAITKQHYHENKTSLNKTTTRQHYHQTMLPPENSITRQHYHQTGLLQNSTTTRQNKTSLNTTTRQHYYQTMLPPEYNITR